MEAGVKRVVAAMRDPNPAVAGRGFRQLRAAGVEVVTGVAEAEAQRLNEAFAVWIRTHRPLVTLKSAMTLDSHMILPDRTGTGRTRSPHQTNRRSRWITSEAARAEVHRMRHASDAILTGIGTVLADDPLLTDRTGLPRRRPLLRVVLDSRLRLPLCSQLARTANGDVLVFTCASQTSPRGRALTRSGIEIFRVRPRAGRPDLRAVLAALGRRGILSVLLEPGPTLHQAALDAGLVDKVRLFYAPTLAGLPTQAPRSRSQTHPRLRLLLDLRMQP